MLFFFLCFLTGGYMLADGLHVIIYGKYIGPAKPGPWAIIFEHYHINVLKLAPLFIAYGVAWLVYFAAYNHRNPLFKTGIALCLLTLWYLPFGTLCAVIVAVLLIIAKYSTGKRRY